MENKEEIIDKLLCFMKDVCEEHGVTIKHIWFNFLPEYTQRYFNAPDEIIPDGEDLKKFKELYPLSNEEIKRAINSCITHNYINRRCLNQEYDKLQLTDEGLARANSVEKSKNYKSSEPVQQNITINQERGGNVQVGNHNSINIENTFHEIIREIESSNATEEQKAEAKGLIQKLIDHPVISAILSGTALIAIQKMLG